MKLKERKAAMKDRKGKSVTRKAGVTVVERSAGRAIRGYFAEREQVLLPMLELIEDAKASVDELMNAAACSFVEQLLVISAQEVAGAKHPGRVQGEIGWHGSQRGRIVLSERKLEVDRPRLRTKGRGGREVNIPVYQRLQGETKLADRMRDILVAGVSTRKYEKVLPKMARTVGIAKSSVSRKFILASERALEALMSRRLEEIDLLAVYLDGIVVAQHHILAGIGVDGAGDKHLLGLVCGSSENAEVVKDLLNALIERGLSTQKRYLFVIDGAKALRKAIDEVFGDRALVQRCRVHKVRNVSGRLPRELATQVKSVMHAAYQLPEKEGIAKLKQQAKWLQAEYPDAAASLLEGLEETFTLNHMKLSTSLMRGLTTTNIIENPNGTVRNVTRRVARYRDANMALRWVATGFLEAEKKLRKLSGYRDLWMLKSALGRDGHVIEAKRNAA
jgi:transposase-like protein